LVKKEYEKIEFTHPDQRCLRLDCTRKPLCKLPGLQKMNGNGVDAKAQIDHQLKKENKELKVYLFSEAEMQKYNKLNRKMRFSNKAIWFFAGAFVGGLPLAIESFQKLFLSD